MSDHQQRQILQKNSRRIKGWLIFVAFILVLGLFFWPQISEWMIPHTETSQTKKRMKIDFQTINSKEVVKPKFMSMDSRDQPYTVNAEKGFKEAGDQIFLQQMSALLALNTGAHVALKADTGTIEQEAHDKADLKGHVNVIHDEGYEMLTNSAHVDFKTGIIEGHEPVEGASENGYFQGQGFAMDKDKNEIKLKGRSRVIFYK